MQHDRGLFISPPIRHIYQVSSPCWPWAAFRGLQQSTLSRARHDTVSAATLLVGTRGAGEKRCRAPLSTQTLDDRGQASAGLSCVTTPMITVITDHHHANSSNCGGRTYTTPGTEKPVEF